MGTTRLDQSTVSSFSRSTAGLLCSAAGAISRHGRWLIDTTAVVAARHQRRRRLRRDLRRLSDHMLKDIGVAREDLVRESHKSIWRE